MAVDAGNVLVGRAYTFTAPEGTAAPADDTPATQFADWTSPWTSIGATQEGVTWGVVQNSNDIPIEEQSTPARITINTTDISIATVLSEDTLETMKLAFGGGTITTTAPGVGQIGKKVLVLGDTVTTFALGFDAINADDFYRRVVIPKVVSIANVQTAYRRAADARRYAVTFRAICAPSDVSITEKTADAT